MTQPIPWTIVFPVLLQLLQAILLLLIAITALRRRKLLFSPLAGMDYATVAFSAAVLLGILIIASGSSEAMMRTFKTAHDGDWQSILVPFCRFFVVSLCGVGFFLSVAFGGGHLLGSAKKETTITEGKLPLALLSAGITVGTAIAINAIAIPIYEWLTPIYLNFR